MAHPSQREFVEIARKHFPASFHACDVLEIGSLDLNGSVRDYFQDCRYTGLDVAPGPGVDVVCQGQDFHAPAASFDHVISCEAMEHNPYWFETFANMVRLCRPGGLFLMTCATIGRREHGTARTEAGSSPLTAAWNYYRNLRSADFRGFDLDRLFSAFGFWSNWRSYDLYFCGIRSGCDSLGLLANWPAFYVSIRSHLAKINRPRWYRAVAAMIGGEFAFRKARAITGR